MSNGDAFLAIIRAGLWKHSVRLLPYGKIDFSEIMRLAEEQSVVGLVTVGLEYVEDVKVPKENLLQFIGQSLKLEQTNTLMNSFIEDIIDKMRRVGIYTLLVKGQGIAQCYENPLWRCSGDVDFLFNNDNYQKAKEFLLPLSSSQKPEESYSQHLGMSIDPWYVEIHGSLRTGLSAKVDKVVDNVQRDVFYGGNVRSWKNGRTTIFLPSPDNDVFFVFTHFIKHFYKDGMNLRQVCDWCRLLWTYRKKIDVSLLESRIRKAGLMSEWSVFAALAVEYLGMPMETMPLYDSRFKIKGSRVLKHILKGEPYSKMCDTWAKAKLFPWHTLEFAPSIFFNVNGLKIKERLFN